MRRQLWIPAACLLLPVASVETPQAAAAHRSHFVCTQVMGVSVTGDWFGAGFEKAVGDGSKWQAVWRKHAFVDQWSDPKNELWSIAPQSACTKDADQPDRILFTGVNWEFKTAQQWTTALTGVVHALQVRYPRVKRIELLTMLRGPGNQSCGSPMTVVAPHVDEAVASVAAAFPRLVQVGPKLEAPSCAVFAKGGPHFTETGVAEVARVYAAHYARD